LAAWIGFAIGTAVRIWLAFAMVGIFLAGLYFSRRRDTTAARRRTGRRECDLAAAAAAVCLSGYVEVKSALTRDFLHEGQDIPIELLEERRSDVGLRKSTDDVGLAVQRHAAGL